MPTRAPRSSGYSTKDKLARREAKAQRKRDGVCIACPMKALSGLVRCAACHAKQTERDRLRALGKRGAPDTGRATLVRTWLALERARLPGRVFNVLDHLADGCEHSLHPQCLTLGDVADLDITVLYKFKNFGRGSVRALQESLARAGVVADWCAPRRPATEKLDNLRNSLTVLAAAWASNANHDPHPGTACAWRSASEALDELLEAD